MNHVLPVTTGYVLLAVFGGAWIVLGLWWGRRAKDLDGFMLAGRNVGLSLGSATTMATWVTSNTILLAPALALTTGIWGMVAYATASFGLILFAPLAARIRALVPRGYTSGDFIRLRFGRTAWAVFLLISFVYSMAWLASMATAGGLVLESLAGVPFAYGMSVILAVCVIYTLFGGMYAVIGTDFIQSIIILIGIVAVGVAVFLKIDPVEVHARLTEQKPALLDVFMPVALLAIFNNMFFGFGEIFHNNVWWSRAYAMRKDVAPKAFFLSGLLWFPIPIAAGFIALSAGALGIHITDPNTVGPLVAAKVLGSAGAVAVFIVVFCSLASSIDSLLAATSDLLTEDIYRRLVNPGASEATLRRAASYLIVALGVGTWLICLGKFDLLPLLFLSGPFVASAIWPVIAGLYWERASSHGAVAAMILGSITGVFVYYMIGWFAASLVAAAVSAAITIASRYVAPDTPFDWKKLAS